MVVPCHRNLLANLGLIVDFVCIVVIWVETLLVGEFGSAIMRRMSHNSCFLHQPKGISVSQCGRRKNFKVAVVDREPTPLRREVESTATWVEWYRGLVVVEAA